MTRRTNQTKTTIYRRHAEKCPLKGQPNNVTRCECPLWLHGKIKGKFLRVSLDTRSLSEAEMRQQDLEHGPSDDPTPGGGISLVGAPHAGAENVSLDYAAEAFLKTSSSLASGSQRLYRRAMRDFGAWAAQQGIVRLRAVTCAHIQHYFECRPEWSRNTAQGQLVYLRVFFNFCARPSRRWVEFAPTAEPELSQRGRARGKTSARVPFTVEETTRILTTIEALTPHYRDRARALVYLMLNTGMRISDAAYLERSYIGDDNLCRYWAIKTGKQIALAPELGSETLDALAKLATSRVYFFRPDRDGDYADARRALAGGKGEFSQLMPLYQTHIDNMTRLIRRVLRKAGIKGGCHKFRDTFAINLLSSGADIYTVSKMLGHSDVRITDRHYLKLVPGYSEQLSRATRQLAYQYPQAS